MVGFDFVAVREAASFAGHHPVIDMLMLGAATTNTFKVMPFIAVFFWLWASDKGDGQRHRAVMTGFVGAFGALVLARLVQDLGPHRPRPMDSGLFQFAVANDDPSLDWSSFPSDTSALVFALAFAIWSASRPWGVLAFLWAGFIAAAKLYGGYHYPSDILEGSLIGIGAVYLSQKAGRFAEPLFARCEALGARHPGLFAMAAFVLAFQLGTLFGEIRGLGHNLVELIRPEAPRTVRMAAGRPASSIETQTAGARGLVVRVSGGL
jgi:undecaprenyl-diphosphatase